MKSNHNLVRCRVSTLRRVIFSLLVIIVALALPGAAAACGFHTHAYIAQLATNILHQPTFSQNYSDLVRILDTYPNWVEAGEVFPDWGMAGEKTVSGCGQVCLEAGEIAHGHIITSLTFQEALKSNLVPAAQRSPRTAADEQAIAFLFGVIGHNIQDENFDKGLMAEDIRIDSNDTHESIDLAVNAFTIIDLGGHSDGPWAYPYDAIKDTYNDLGYPVPWEWLRDGTGLGLSSGYTFQEDASRGYYWPARLLNHTWLYGSYQYYELGGLNDLANRTAMAWMQTWDQINSSAIYHVKPAAGGNKNCLSWDNACTLQSALGQAVNGEIWVAAGMYTPTDDAANRNDSFRLRSSVAVYGGFNGTETARDQRDPAANLTILSGDIDNNDSQKPIITDLSMVTGNTTNSYHVVTGASNATLDGFIVTAGYANGSNAINGGGMINYSSPTVTEVTFSGNFASSAGGGMYNYYSSPTLTDVTFSGNTATNNGGGIYNDHSNPTLTDVTFQSNMATNGGGIENFVSSPVLTNITFFNNIATNGNGGGMRNASQTICNPYGLGSNCHIDIGSPTLTNVTFSGNVAKLGGGIDNDISSPTLTNVTFNGNTATTLNGGGSIHNKSQYKCMSWIFTGCSGSYWYVSAPIVQNSILWGDSGGDVYDEIIREDVRAGDPPSRTQIGNSVIQGGCPVGTTCSNIFTADPKLGTLGDYGGYTPTIPLLWGSSAIDAGYDAACPAIDQRGVIRPQGAHCDIGATEMLLSEIDTIPPSITGTVTTLPNDSGWYNSDVTVHFTAEDAQSGVSTVTPDQTLTAEAANQFVTGTAVDIAGNTATVTVGPINIDKTPPAISGAATTSPNDNGWYNSDVTVHFTAEDLPSGLDTLTSDQTLAGEGAGQSVTGTAADLAGNSASVTVGPINIDKTPPMVTVSVDKDRYTKTEPFIVHFNGSDALSGVSSLTAEFNGQSVTDGQVVDLFWLPLGTYTLTARAEDLAGNITEASQSIELSATLESLQETVARLCTEGYIMKEGTCNELSAKLDAAIAAQNRGNDKTAANLLRAFQNAVNAQTDKSIQGSAAQLLLLDSEYMKDKLSR
jgi:predicted outer membrane repeat protein